ncbi:DUF3035 domain-containing protein [Candidatus Pelagibacter sp. FZCC0015]|uniref:DUF3035 domain-containing protein n=1 Tax=Candidatus Pelagibacter sp. FZCC0015 TaxID=2268451 RepID=UPI00119F41AB|nr:DUF3035 domain-containing protein [Candidatus Pelagibacter sp. FZCC0015]
MKFYKILIILNLLLLLQACGTVKEGFSNQKKNSSDEFLVEKKAPLVMPPNYNELPVPKSKKIEKKAEDNAIKNFVKNNGIDSAESNEVLEVNKNLEESLLEKIKKNN